MSDMSNNRVFVVMRGIVFAALFISLWVWLATLVRRYDAAIGTAPPAWLQPIGWALAVPGAALGLTCVWLFLTAGRGTPAPFDPPKVFVASGPYRYVRNPMYVGGILALAGGGLIIGSYSILILAAVFWALAHVLVLLHEEPALEERFGDSFVQYKRQVNRWLPRVPSA